MQAVAEFRQTAFSVWQYAAISRSNSLVRGPVVIHPERSAWVTSCASVAPTSGGEKGIFFRIHGRMLVLQIYNSNCTPVDAPVDGFERGEVEISD